MNDFINMLKDRRSVRAYASKPIDKTVLQELVDCARLAPTARNIQPWKFIIVTDRANLSEISRIVEYGHFIKDAAACIVVCGEKEANRHVEDCCIAAENIMLSAKSLGIGSCYVAALEKNMKDARKLLKLPEKYQIVCFISLGYITTNPQTPKKKHIKDVIHWEKF
jgi:nitroreductase